MSDEREHRFYEAFDPDAPAAAELDRIYVSLDEARGGSVTRLLTRGLQNANPARPVCRLIAGHKGCGKTVELMHMARELERDGRFTVFHWLAESTIDLAGVDFPDLALGLVGGLSQWLKKVHGIELKPGYFSNLGVRLKDYLQSEVAINELELADGMAKVTAHIKQSPTLRAQVRAALDPDSDSLLEAVNSVIGEAKQALANQGKPANLVILVDDLDKGGWDRHPTAGMTTGEFLFDKRHLQLRGLNCHVVYVLPLDLAYGRLAGILQNRYGDIPLIPMVEVRTRPPEAKPFEPGIKALRNLIRRRLENAGLKPEEVFEAEVEDTLIRICGGEPRQLMYLLRSAQDYGELPIRQAAAQRAIEGARKTLRRPMGREDWEMVKELARNGELPKDSASEERTRQLMVNRQILQYSNGTEWFAPNPLLGDPPV
jgi:AAA ATPase domain